MISTAKESNYLLSSTDRTIKSKKMEIPNAQTFFNRNRFMHKLMPSYLTVTRNSNIFVGDCKKREPMWPKKRIHTHSIFNALIPLCILTQTRNSLN